MKTFWLILWFVFAGFLGFAANNESFTIKQTVMFSALYVMSGIIWINTRRASK